MGNIERLIQKFAVQTAVYWGNPTPNGYGGFTYDPPREIKVRWDDSQKLTSKNGTPPRDQGNITSDSVLLVTEDLDINGLIWIGTLNDLFVKYNNIYSLAWSDPLCVTNDVVYQLSWSDSLCLYNTTVWTLAWTDLVCTSIDAPRKPMYGYIYDDDAVTDVRDIAPTGYRVGGYDDWWALYTMGYPDGYYPNTGNALKSDRIFAVDGHPGWAVGNTGGDIVGFSILPTSSALNVGEYFTSNYYFQHAKITFSAANGTMTFTAKPSGYKAGVRCIRETLDGYVEGEIVTDIDGNQYDTVFLDFYVNEVHHQQVWLKQNLAVTKYSNGDAIDSELYSAITGLENYVFTGTTFDLSIKPPSNAPAVPGTFIFCASSDISSNIQTSEFIDVVTTVTMDGVYYKHSVDISCELGKTGSISILTPNRIVSLGSFNGDDLPTESMYNAVNFYAPEVYINFENLPVNLLKITQLTECSRLFLQGTSGLPSNLKVLHLYGLSKLFWTFNDDAIDNLEHLYIHSNSVSWHSTKELPSVLKLLYIVNGQGTIYWDFINSNNEQFPVNLEHIEINAVNCDIVYNNVPLPTGLKVFKVYDGLTWSYTGALPTTIEQIDMYGNITWSDSNNFSESIKYLRIACSGVNWTGTGLPGNENLIMLQLLNYRSVPLTSQQMLQFISSLMNRGGTFPETIVVYEYADSSVPPENVLAARIELENSKNTTLIF